MAMAPLVLQRKTGCVIAPITRNRRRTYEFEVSMAERSDDDNARNVCETRERKSSEGTFNDAATTRPRHLPDDAFYFYVASRRVASLSRRLDVGYDRTTILFSRRRLSSARADGVRTA